ncbi:hypothetical protein F5878DRAFT_616703 [Lentinula raphanica]|uniref:Secreted protein n=1 Tax=Lentinula raphanica TaxID=153919 RepID=A0AA38PAK7_9AGAR|nr:hypothetical protein F5878DRAFT_616703 [Lentinula raphanica]
MPHDWLAIPLRVTLPSFLSFDLFWPFLALCGWPDPTHPIDGNPKMTIVSDNELLFSNSQTHAAESVPGTPSRNVEDHGSFRVQVVFPVLTVITLKT